MGGRGQALAEATGRDTSAVKEDLRWVGGGAGLGWGEGRAGQRGWLVWCGETEISEEGWGGVGGGRVDAAAFDYDSLSREREG